MSQSDSNPKINEPSKEEAPLTLNTHKETSVLVNKIGGKLSKRKVDIALIISIAALVLSGIQLVLSSPAYLKYYNTPLLSAHEEYQFIDRDHETITFVYRITNIGNQPAEDVTIRFRALENDIIQFMPSEVVNIQSDMKGIPLRNHTYKIENLVPGESYHLFIYSNTEDIKEQFKVEKFEVDTSYQLPNLFLGPYLESVKTSQGLMEIERKNNMKLSYLKTSKTDAL
jgi:hypothetical protein